MENSKLLTGYTGINRNDSDIKNMDEARKIKKTVQKL
jgi:hypothetical protein